MVSKYLLHKYRWQVIICTALLLGLSVCAATALFIKPALATHVSNCSGGYFICPHNGSGVNVWDGSLGLTAYDSDNQPGGPDTDAEPVRAGETIHVEMSFTVNSGSTFGGQVLAWVNADIHNNCSDPKLPLCQNGGFSNFTRSPAVGTLINPPISNTNTPSNGYQFSDPPIKDNNCPSFYASASSNYTDPANPAPGGTLPFTSPGSIFAGSSYTSTCGYQGASVMWYGDMRSPTSLYKYGFDFKVNPFTTNEGNICFRANVSVGSGSALAIVTNLYARSASRLCFKVKTTTVQGLVKSSDTEATGKGLYNVPVTYSRTCDPANVQTVNTAGNGLYTFESTEGQHFCIYAPTAPLVVDGTTYRSVSPSGYSNEVCNVGFCNGYDFTYTPASLIPDITKSASTNANLKPGDPVVFTVTVTNPYDSNMQNVNITDYIPLNLKTGGGFDPEIVSVEMQTNSASPPRPSGWTATLPNSPTIASQCSVSRFFPISYIYGDGSPLLSSNIRCGYYKPPAGTAERPNMYVTFDRLPAYSTMVLQWRGYVKPNTEIGVYPADNTCKGIYASGDGYHPECVDKANGLQGVSNVATVAVTSIPAPQDQDTDSLPTYNTIEGDILDVTKGSGLTDTDDPDSFVEYDPSDTGGIDHTTFNLGVVPDPSKGPVEFQVIDQTNGATNNTGSTPLASAIQPTSCYGAAGAATSCSNAEVRFPYVYWPIGSTNTNAWFDAKFVGNPAVGTPTVNKIKACWPQYWLVGHAIACRESLPYTMERVKTNYPYFGAQKGGVHAGGSFIAEASSGLCKPLNPGEGRVNGNRSSYGQYVVTAAGSLDGITSKLGLDNVGGNQCRPNIPDQLNTYMNKTPNSDYVGKINANTFNQGTDNQINNKATQNGHARVLLPHTSPGDVTIGPKSLGDFMVKARYTLYVQGDLYIDTDIKDDTGTFPLTGQPSLGIVVTGNVYISKDVTQIDALIFAGDYNKTTHTFSGGIINTCANNAGKTIGQVGGYNVNLGDCKSQLVVNGALMGRIIQFTRTRTNTGAGNEEAEIVALVGRAYALPPPGFTNLSLTKSATVSEPPPRF